jgi:hypothetical protein
MTTWLRLLKLVNACDAAALSPVLLSAKGIKPARKVKIMLIVLQHRITNPATAFTRGQNLLDGNGAPQGTRVLQFYPSTDRNAVFCLWESNSIDELREYVDAVMGDSSENSYFEVDAEIARGLPRLVGA